MNAEKKEWTLLGTLAVAALVCIVLALCLQGCSSSKKAVSRDVSHVSANTVVNTIKADTGEYSERSSAVATVRECHESRDSGMVMIDRDMSGRPVLVKWNVARKGKVSGKSTETTVSEGSFSVKNRENVRKSTENDTSQVISQETRERPIPWECRIGWTIFGLMALYLLYLFVVEYLMPLLKGWKR